jgi:molecular chaperone Hsp33
VPVRNAIVLVVKNSPTSPHKVHRFVTNDLTIRVAAVDATAVVAEMQNIQNSSPLATIGVGRAMVGALLMASQLKDGQEVGILLKGNGPLGSLYGQASYEGNVRGYCPHPHYFPPNEEDALNLRKAIGFGHLTVSRQQPFQRQPFFGTVEMISGEVGDDIAHYLHQSHQIRSLVSLGVSLDKNGKVISAGGVLLEVMPGVEERVVELIQENADHYKENVSQEILKGKTPFELVAPYLKGLPYQEIAHDFEVQYFCPCTQERVLGALGTLGLADLTEMITDNENAEITCQMCGRRYSISVPELQELKDSLHRNSMH